MVWDCREQLAGERRVELQRLEAQNKAAEAHEAAEEERLRREELRYRMELQVSPSVAIGALAAHSKPGPGCRHTL